jgi:hypothetical protein
MMKKTAVTFNEQKSEYHSIEEKYISDDISKEDSIMNKMLTQLVIIGLIGMILLFFIFQIFTKDTNIEDGKLSIDVVFELNEENQELNKGIKNSEKSIYTMTLDKEESKC